MTDEQDEISKKLLSKALIAAIEHSVGVPKPGHTRLMAPLPYEDAVRLFNSLYERFSVELDGMPIKEAIEAVAQAANTFLTKIDRVRAIPPRPNYLAHITLKLVSEDSEQLQDAMHKYGFERFTDGKRLGGGEVRRMLPSSMYYFDSDTPANQNREYTLRQAYKAVKSAVGAVLTAASPEAQAANTPPHIFVVQAMGLWWTGLDDIPKSTKRKQP